MSKFKIGDKVVLAPGTGCATDFYDLQGDRDYYTVTDVASEGAFWLQLDFKTCNRVNPYPWPWAYFNMYQEPVDELPPVPSSVSYLNTKRDPGNDQRLVLERDSETDEGLLYIGIVPRKSSTRAEREIGINMSPDSALQLAHDLRRMAMDIKRKEKAQ